MFSTPFPCFLQAFCFDDHATASRSLITVRRLKARRTRRWAAAATPILAVHAGLAWLAAQAIVTRAPMVETPPIRVELVDPPAPTLPPPPPAPAPDPAPEPETTASPAPAQKTARPNPAPQRRPPAVAAARPRPTPLRRPPEVEPLRVPPAPPGPPLPLLGAAEIAGALTAGAGPGGGSGDSSGGGGQGGLGAGSGAGSGAGGGRCDMVRWVQDAVRDDQAVRRAVIAASRDMDANGRAILVWNGDWLQSRDQAGKGLAGVRQAIALEVAFAPEACKRQPMTGLAVLKLEDRPGGAQLALGKGSWRWSDLLNAG